MPRTYFDVTITTTLTANATVSVWAEDQQDAERQIGEQLGQRGSPATSELAQAFEQVVRKEHFDYDLEVEIGESINDPENPQEDG